MSLVTYVGGVESDSFITVAEALVLIGELFTDISAWEVLSEPAQEFRLQLGAHLMGHLSLRGRTVYVRQGLCFPRTVQPLAQRSQIPYPIKKAQAYLSFSVVHRALATIPEVEAGLPEPFGSPSQISLAGLVSVSFKGADSSGGITLLEKMVASLPFPVMMLMKPYLSQVRGGIVVDEEDAITLSTTTTTTALVPTTTTTV